jgi:hypothetical protein
MYKHPKARKQFLVDFCKWILTCLLMSGLLIINSTSDSSTTVDLIFFGLVVVVEVSAWLVSRIAFRHWFHFPVNLDTLQTRWGIWVMIVIGESAIQMLHSFSDPAQLYNVIQFMGVALLLLFLLSMQYFDACQVEWYEHALTKSALAGVSWVWLHVPLTLYLFRMGSWLRVLAVSHNEMHHLSPSDCQHFSVFLGVVTMLTTLMRTCNAMPDSTTDLTTTLFASEARSIGVFLLRFAISAVQITIGFKDFDDGHRSPMTLLTIQCGLVLATTVIDVCNDIVSRQSKIKELAAKEAHELAIKSRRQFPKQWNKLDLLTPESLLAMNLKDVAINNLQTVESCGTLEVMNMNTDELHRDEDISNTAQPSAGGEIHHHLSSHGHNLVQLFSSSSALSSNNISRSGSNAFLANNDSNEEMNSGHHMNVNAPHGDPHFAHLLERAMSSRANRMLYGNGLRTMSINKIHCENGNMPTMASSTLSCGSPSHRFDVSDRTPGSSIKPSNRSVTFMSSTMSSSKTEHSGSNSPGQSQGHGQGQPAHLVSSTGIDATCGDENDGATGGTLGGLKAVGNSVLTTDGKGAISPGGTGGVASNNASTDYTTGFQRIQSSFLSFLGRPLTPVKERPDSSKQTSVNNTTARPHTRYDSRRSRHRAGSISGRSDMSNDNVSGVHIPHSADNSVSISQDSGRSRHSAPCEPPTSLFTGAFGVQQGLNVGNIGSSKGGTPHGSSRVRNYSADSTGSYRENVNGSPVVHIGENDNLSAGIAKKAGMAVSSNNTIQPMYHSGDEHRQDDVAGFIRLCPSDQEEHSITNPTLCEDEEGDYAPAGWWSRKGLQRRNSESGAAGECQ